MMVVVKAFGFAADVIGNRTVHMDLPGDSTVSQLLEAMAGQFPSLAGHLPSLAIAVNHRRAGPDQALSEGDEVALLPPVSGGGIFGLTHEPLSADEVAESVKGPGVGAVAVFVGTVREITAERRTAYLEYEAYDQMAEQELRVIGREVQDRWSGARVAIVHRLGRLAPGEASVVIAVGTPHRPQAFDACRHALEMLKERVPVWKKEVYQDGAEEWVVPGEDGGVEY